MTQPVSDGTGDDLDLDAPLTLADYIDIVTDGLEEAAHNLEPQEVEQLCRAIREKIGAIIEESRRWKPDDKPVSETDRDPNDRWWDR